MQTVLVRVPGFGVRPDPTVWDHPRVIKYDPCPHSTGPEVEYTLDYSSEDWTELEAEVDAISVMQELGFRVLAVGLRGWR